MVARQAAKVWHDNTCIDMIENSTGRCKKLKSAAQCKRGFPNPRDCSQCICPGGYGGPLCDQRPYGCGKTLEATDKLQTFSYTLGQSGNTAQRKGRRVYIRIKDVFSQWIGPGCFTGGLEIKPQKDQRLTGYRYCKQSSAGKVFESEVDLVPVILYRDRGMVIAQWEYRMSMFY
ncbi:unnamed protein product [Cylicocyclus nassatus]|uniref:Peptidase M12A domain-containing protein n=1 Tax=Cylicocyclus nassatus TaxID=53992 RepID=A0AA36M1M5_CYLNA|nr:unnamed protein product [Cylicocyclus nassatus]